LPEEHDIAAKATIPDIKTFAFMTPPPDFLFNEKISTFATKFI